MGRWRPVGPVTPLVLSPWFSYPLDLSALSTTPNGSITWGTANLAVFFPVDVPEPCLLTKLWWQNGGTAAGNVDVGVYDDQGNRLVSTGSTAQAGTSAIQSVDITDVWVPAGVLYFALAASSASATFWSTATAHPVTAYGLGVYRQTSAFPLPNPATFATAKDNLPVARKFGALVFPRTVL